MSIELSPPKVSVIVLSYNHERYIVECLDSIAAQTLSDFEIIVVDDGSRDGSVAKIQQWKALHPDIRCEVIIHEQNRGLCAGLNEALSVAQGQYVAEIASDDLMEPRKLEVQAELLDRLPETTALVYSDAYLFGPDGQGLDACYLAGALPSQEPPHGEVFRQLLHGNFIAPMTMMLRRSALDAVGRYDERLFFEDWDMFLRVTRRFAVAFSPYVSAWYRISPNSAWRSPRNQARIEESTALIFMKWLPQLEGEDRLVALGALFRAARRLHVLQREVAFPYFRSFARAHSGVRSKLVWASVRLGASPSALTRLLTIFQRVGGPWLPEPRKGVWVSATGTVVS